jgi:AcrR family transcriptional regulator
MARPRDPAREAERRQAILSAAASVFADHGLKGAPIAAICRAAGISPGHLYYYFPSKESLIEAMAAADLAAIRGYAERLTTLDELLDAAVASTDPSGAEGPAKLLAGPLAFDLMAEAQRNPRVRAILQAHYEEVTRIFGARLAQAQAQGQVAAAQDPERFARLVGAVREGLLVLTAIDGRLVDPAIRRQVRAMLDGAARAG